MSEGPEQLDAVVARDAFKRASQLAPNPLDGATILARHLLTRHDGQLRLRLLPETATLLEAIQHDLLVIAAIAPYAPADRSGVWLLWPSVLPGEDGPHRQVLARPIAECHMHLAGSMSTDLLWVMALHPRGIDAQVLRERLPECMAREALARARVALGRLCLHVGGETAGEVPATTPRDLDPPIRDLLDRWFPVGDDDRIAGMVDVAPGGHWADGTPGIRRMNRLVAFERRLLLAAWRERRRVGDDLLGYLQLRNAFHHELLCGRGPRGLARFRASLKDRHYYFMGTQQEGSGRRRLLQLQAHAITDACLADAASPHGGFRPWSDTPPPRRQPYAHLPRIDLEMRIAPEGAALPDQVVSRLRGVAEALEGWPGARLRVGFVVHFSKSEDRNVGGLAGHTARDHAVNLKHALLDFPLLRPFIVGIDACGDEMAGNPREFASAFAAVRAFANQHVFNGPPVNHIGATFHAGEDFRDLLTGIRHIDECVVVLALGGEDRIGHGLALAWDPRDFYRVRPTTWPRLRDHVLDLLWLWGVLEREGHAQDALYVCTVVERVIIEAGGHAHISDLRNALLRMDIDGHRRRPLDALAEVQQATDPAFDTFDEHVCTEEAILCLAKVPEEEWDQLLTVHGSDATWQRLLLLAQAQVQARIARAGVSVELNPSSNVRVAGMHAYEYLPYDRLTNTGLGPEVTHRIRVSLNTDDPGMFQTSLRNEYRWMAQALKRRGFTPDQIGQWLEAARVTSLETTFIPEDSPEGQELITYVRDHLSQAADWAWHRRP